MTMQPMRLQDLALRRAAVVLCSCPKMYIFAAGMKDKSKEEFEPEMHKVSRDIVANFSLPLLLEQDLLGAMKAASREVIKWVKFHEDFLELYDGVLSRLDNLENIRWTRVGTVNYLKTAQVLIFNRKLNVENRYKLACLYCISRLIIAIWETLPNSYKEMFFTNGPLTARQPRIVIVWTFIITKNLSRLRLFLPPRVRDLHSVEEFIFEYVALQGYGAATQYFFQTLADDMHKLPILMRVAVSVASRRRFDKCSYLHEYQRYSDVLSYLMSRMPESEQKHLCCCVPFEVLKCLLDWPHQSEFFRHAKFVLRSHLLTEEEYSRLLFILASNSSSGFNYPRMFRIFFSHESDEI